MTLQRNNVTRLGPVRNIIALSVLLFAYLIDEKVVRNTRYCYYDYFGRTHIMTVDQFKYCPLSVELDG